MNKIDDETLMAYADSELNEEEMKAVELVLADDADARAKVEDFRKTGEAISQYTAILDEPVPEHLNDTIRQHTKPSGVVRFPRSKFRQNWMALAASLVIGVALGSAKFYADQTTENETKLVFRGGEGAREIQHNKVELVEALPSSSALVLRKLEIETRLNKILEEVAGSERIVEKVQVNLARNSKLKVVSTFLSDTQFKNEKLTKCIVTEFSEPGLAHPILFVACRNVAGSWKIVSG